jgi:type III secretory pathway lipoprotein EscJ
LFLTLSLITGCRATTSLATVADESEAIEILNVLHENGIQAHKEEIGEEGAHQWQIILDQSWLSDSSEVAMANQVLQDNGLPRPSELNKKAPAESGVFEDEATRKARQLKERELDLQKKMRLLPGVIGVQISIVEPEDSSININPYPSTASVLIVTKDDPPNFNPDTVRGLVARSVPKLNPDNVYVAVTTKPVRPLPWREFGAQRRHKGLDAIGIGILIILASSVVVLLLQMRRQSRELSELRQIVVLRDKVGEEQQEAPTGGAAEPAADEAARALRTASVPPTLDSTSQRAIGGT